MRRSRLAELAGVPASTIKHYVQVGLLPPPVTRPNARMAYYDEGLVDRVRAIKVLQTERFLPLPAILALLGPPPAPGEQRDEEARARQLATLEPALTPPPGEFRTRKDTLRTVSVTTEELDTLEATGLLRPSRGPRGVVGYQGVDLELLRIIDDARTTGLGGLFTMAVLAPYVAAIRGLVELELELFRQRIASGAPRPDLPLPEVAKRAQQLAERLLVVLRRKLTLEVLHGQQRSAGRPRGGARPGVRTRK